MTAPTPEALERAIIAASDAAADNGLVAEVAGVLYRPGDCAVVEEEAAMAAIEDARVQAARLAPLLDVTLGGVLAPAATPISLLCQRMKAAAGSKSASTIPPTVGSA